MGQTPPDTDDESVGSSLCESIDYSAEICKLADEELAVVAGINASYDHACERLEAALASDQLTGAPGAVDTACIKTMELTGAIVEARKLGCHDGRSRRLLATATVARRVPPPRGTRAATASASRGRFGAAAARRTRRAAPRRGPRAARTCASARTASRRRPPP